VTDRIFFQMNIELETFRRGGQHARGGGRNLRPDAVTGQNHDTHDDSLNNPFAG
jgi:hypothetical protein